MASYWVRLDGKKVDRVFTNFKTARGAGTLAFQMGATNVDIVDDTDTVIYVV